MTNTTKQFNYVSALILLALGLGLSGCMSSSGELSRAQKEGDRQVAEEVKTKLHHDPEFKFPDVEAVVYEGTVQLAGFVYTPEQRSRAAVIASRARGVQQVINSIALKPTPTGPAQPGTNSFSAPPPPEASQPPAQGAASPDQPPTAKP
jgi:hypothetical protein